MDLDIDNLIDDEEKPDSEARDVLGIIRDQIFSLPLLPQKQVLELFNLLDQSLQRSIDELLSKGNFVESYLSDVIAEVAASVTHGRTIYGHSVKRRRTPGTDEESEDGNEDVATNAVFKRASDVRFLEQSINILHLLSSYQDSTDGQRKDLTDKILRDTKFVRLVYEEVIQRFIDNTKTYRVLSMQAAEAHNDLHSQKNKTEVSGSLAEYSQLHEQLAAIESAVKVERAYLYHLRGVVENNDKQQKKIRDMIYEPYLRIVYKEAKRHATNEQQVLDNFQNGSQGLIRAISCYNLDRNVSFSSYAHWWIRQSILFHIKDSSNFVKLPVTTWQSYTAVEKERSRVVAKCGDDSIEALAQGTGHSVEKLKEIYDSVRSSHVRSLDYEMDESGKLMLIDVLPDSSIEEREKHRDTQVEVIERLRVLTDDQRWVTILTFGLLNLLEQEPINDRDLVAEKMRQKLAGRLVL